MALEASGKLQYSFGVLAGLFGELMDAMAREVWITTSDRWCDMIQAEAHMMERRVLPANIMPEFPRYRVTAKKCSLGTACNLAGYPCKWAYNELGNDPFKPTV